MKATARSRQAAALLAAAFLGWTPLACKDTAPPAQRPASGPAAAADHDQEYVNALSAANEFCLAWKRGELRAAKALLSPRLLRRYPDSRLNAAIGPSGNRRHAAFEISPGRRLPGGRVQFKVRLFHVYAGQIDDRIEAPLAEMVMARDDSNHWRVDEFPIP